MVEAGMDVGMREGYEQLDELLSTSLKPRH
jgi:hypothetical protein